MKYKLTEKYKDGFSLGDIGYEIDTVCEENKFIDLFNEFYDYGDIDIRRKRLLIHWMQLKTIQNNLQWLEENDFIEEDRPNERWVNLYELPNGDIKAGFKWVSEREAKKDLIPQGQKYLTTVKLPEEK